ncbi:MAG: lipid biosynthesis B12-binding/radical SAM protein [Deltaproteobacteria bacterium]|nr:lipid biosynthesis B12-binding/radical SAM protein [Deltaproteobacteria bacterium]
MSRIFLISSNKHTDPYPVYPLGMAVVARALEATGHSVKQFDCLVQGDSFEELRPAIEAFSPDFLAISIRNIDDVDSFSGEAGWYLGQVKNLIDNLRNISSARVIIGGPGLTIMPETITDYLGADHAVVGEGEKRLPELIAALGAGNPAARVIERQTPLEGNDFSAPLYVAELVEYYQKNSGMVNLQTKRGCSYHCNYCSYPYLEGKRFRVRDPRMVVAELRQLKSDHGVRRLFFTDSVFNDPQDRYLELVEELIRADLDLQWTAFFRPQGFGRSELGLMKRAGLYALELGPDAASDRTLEGIDKRLTFSEVLEVNRACLEEWLPAAHYVIFGGPGENQETLAEGLANLRELGPSVVFAFSGIRIHPGTALQKIAVEDGVITAETSLLKPVYYFSPQIDHRLMEAAIKRDFSGKANRLFPPSEALERMAVMKDFGYRGLMWDKLVRFPKK